MIQFEALNFNLYTYNIFFSTKIIIDENFIYQQAR